MFVGRENLGSKLILPQSPERIKSYEPRIRVLSPHNQVFQEYTLKLLLDRSSRENIPYMEYI